MSADNEINLDIIKATQDTLGRFVKKPPLTEKLLKKPPFRFLHDIITTVIKTTGFFDGLFTADELISENVKDREKKIAFLQKVINVINIVTESSLTVRPSKIISGQEPEKTNELLQKLGEALIQNQGSTQAVEMVLTKNSSPKPNKVISRNKKSDKKGEEKEAKRKIDEKQTKTIPKIESNVKNKTTLSVNVKNVDESKKLNSGKKSNEPKQKIVKQVEKSKSRDIKSTKTNKTEKQSKKIEPTIIKKSDSLSEIDAENSVESLTIITNEVPKMTENSSKIVPHTELVEIEDNPNKNDQHFNTNNIEIKSHEDFSNTHAEVETEKYEKVSTVLDTELEKKEEAEIEIIKKDDSTKSNELSDNKTLSNQEKITSKKYKDKEISNNHKNIENNDKILADVEIGRPRTSLRPPSVRPSSSRPGAPRFKDSNVDIINNSSDNMPVAKVNIIIENYENQPEDDDSSVVVEQTIFDENVIDTDFSKLQVETNGASHGHLVQQILETKKELDGDSTKIEIEWEWGARREREASYKEVENLKNGLQSLSRAANPLGKLIDYVQEDVEIMRQELLHWKDARKVSANLLNHQESLTEKLIQPLEVKLKQLNESIADQTELIYTVKSNIFQNAKKIRKLIDKDELKN